MCGIVAQFSRDGAVSELSLARATRMLEHRGPDGQKMWIAPHQRVGLGHARLSIIDLTTGDQPIANETGSIHICPLDNVKSLLGFVPSWIETFSGRSFKLHELFSNDFTERFSGRDSYRTLLNSIDYWKQLKDREPVHQSLYLWSKTGLPNYILTILGDRMEMAHSIEGRVPFLDHRVVECVCSMPVSLKIRGMTEKYILREAARPVLTDSVYRRQKHPFLSPPATLNPNEGLSSLTQDTLRGPILKSLPFFNQQKVVALLDELPSMDEGQRTVVDQVLMIILSACILQERFQLSL